MTAAPGRSCGTCDACCVVYSIGSLKKPAQVPCEHLCEGGGCSRYATRPYECSTYECRWLQGERGLEDRPDLSGIVARSLGQEITVHELRPGALEREDNAQHVEELCAIAPVAIVRKDGTRETRSKKGEPMQDDTDAQMTFAPDDVLDALIARMQAQRGERLFVQGSYHAHWTFDEGGALAGVTVTRRKIAKPLALVPQQAAEPKATRRALRR